MLTCNRYYSVGRWEDCLPASFLDWQKHEHSSGALVGFIVRRTAAQFCAPRVIAVMPRVRETGGVFDLNDSRESTQRVLFSARVSWLLLLRQLVLGTRHGHRRLVSSAVAPRLLTMFPREVGDWQPGRRGAGWRTRWLYTRISSESVGFTHLALTCINAGCAKPATLSTTMYCGAERCTHAT